MMFILASNQFSFFLWGVLITLAMTAADEFINWWERILVYLGFLEIIRNPLQVDFIYPWLICSTWNLAVCFSNETSGNLVCVCVSWKKQSWQGKLVCLQIFFFHKTGADLQTECACVVGGWCVLLACCSRVWWHGDSIGLCLWCLGGQHSVIASLQPVYDSKQSWWVMILSVGENI